MLDCHPTNTGRTVKQMTNDLMSPDPVHGINGLNIACIKKYAEYFCVMGADALMLQWPAIRFLAVSVPLGLWVRVVNKST